MSIDDETIDLDRAEQAVTLLPDTFIYARYQPTTIHQGNGGRRAYLPAFPTTSYGTGEYSLLAHVPVARLSPAEARRRQHGAYTADALRLTNEYRYSAVDGFSLAEPDAEALASRLQLGQSIITFNADRLRAHCYLFLDWRRVFRHTALEIADRASNAPVLGSKEMAVALEFYLHMDADTFNMKSCMFRGAKPRAPVDNINEGFFQEHNAPEARYTWTACGNFFCTCCYPRNSSRRSQPWPVVDFTTAFRHRFVNGYTTYLNCPATCETSNVIYAMTCPCGKYDYVDSTAATLSNAMNYHREHGNRFIHETLTGSRLYRGSPLDPAEKEKEIANKMRLYHHSARCPVALRSFLDCNPSYWCFVPIPWVDSITENIIHFRTRAPAAAAAAAAAADDDDDDDDDDDAADPEAINIIAMGAINDERVVHYLDHVPRPPSAYGFSFRQRQRQRQFFEQFLFASVPQVPYCAVDLYQTALIAVLPDDCASTLRYLIETLFIVHGETKLNMICPLGGNPNQRYGPPYSGIWCANLNQSSLVSTMITTATAGTTQPLLDI